MRVMQNVREMQKFTALLKAENVTRYLEIGSAAGHSLIAVGKELLRQSHIVAVDLPQNDDVKAELVVSSNHLATWLGHSVNLVFGDSTDFDLIERVRDLGPYDAVFIDANHTLPYVTKDWINYGGMAKLVAFHDINHRKLIDPGRRPIDVPQLWDNLKAHYRHVEFCDDPNINGIGVLWR